MEERHMPTNGENGANAFEAATGSSSKLNGQDRSHGLLGDMQQRVASRVDAQKNRAADGLGGIADVFRTAGNELRNENDTIAEYVDMASDQLRRFADTIRERGVADMLDDVSRFAERRPGLFIGGAFVLGIGLARFLKSSSNHRELRGFNNLGESSN
jgi:hypothetical protein